MPGLEVIVADADGHELQRGSTGELLVRGYSVMQGYLDDPEATAAAIDERGFLRTGDLATMDDRGYVRIVGRSKDMLIVGGFNVYPAEVENTLMGHDAIAQVAVIGVPDEVHGEEIVAVVVAGEGVPSGEEILAYGNEHLGRHKYPRRVEFVDALPLGPSHKVLKRELRDRFGG